VDLSASSYRPEKRDLRILGIAALVMVIWNVISWQFPFFWDTVLNSKIAHWYLESGFSSLTVPESLDAGHPPFFNLYLALVWKVTGPALWAAHLAMLPFLLILLVQFWKLCLRFLPAGMRPAAMILLFCEPTFLAQSSMVTPDIVLVSLFLCSVNAVLEGNRRLLSVALVGLAAATFRGILAVPAIFLIEVGIAWVNGVRKPNWIKIGPYLPVAGLTLLWLWAHYRAVGWLLTPPPETYGAHRQVVGVLDMIRNLGIVGWRFLDFGRVGIWLVLLGVLVFSGRPNQIQKSQFRKLLVMFLAPAALLTVLFIPFSNPIGMRYFLVCYLLLMLGVIWLVGQLVAKRWRKWVLGFMGLALLSGHFWVYPDNIAKSWDSSLAHVPWFMMDDLAKGVFEEGEAEKQVLCTDFPMLASRKYSYVTDKPGLKWQDIKEMNTINQCDCVLWSNISNGFEGPEMQKLKDTRYFKVRMSAQSVQVKMIVYQRVDDAVLH
jgi:hypothetical protein